MKMKGDVKQISQFTYLAIEKFGEIQKGNRQMNIYGPDEQNMVLTFNNRGYLIERKNFSKEGIYSGKLTFGYDNHFRRVEVFGYNIQEKRDYEAMSIFDEGKKIKTTTIKYTSTIPDDAISVKYFDNENRIIREDWLSTNGSLSSRSNTKYDVKGNGYEHNVYGSNGELFSKTENKFDEVGNVIETYNKLGLSSIPSHQYYKYDDSRNLIEEVSSPTGIVNRTTYKYKYDKHRNWIERIRYLNERIPIDLTERIIEYY